MGKVQQMCSQHATQHFDSSRAVPKKAWLHIVVQNLFVTPCYTLVPSKVDWRGRWDSHDCCCSRRNLSAIRQQRHCKEIFPCSKSIFHSCKGSSIRLVEFWQPKYLPRLWKCFGEFPFGESVFNGFHFLTFCTMPGGHRHLGGFAKRALLCQHPALDNCRSARWGCCQLGGVISLLGLQEIQMLVVFRVMSAAVKHNPQFHYIEL